MLALSFIRSPLFNVPYLLLGAEREGANLLAALKEGGIHNNMTQGALRRCADTAYFICKHVQTRGPLDDSFICSIYPFIVDNMLLKRTR